MLHNSASTGLLHTRDRAANRLLQLPMQHATNAAADPVPHAVAMPALPNMSAYAMASLASDMNTLMNANDQGTCLECRLAKVGMELRANPIIDAHVPLLKILPPVDLGQILYLNTCTLWGCLCSGLPG